MNFFYWLQIALITLAAFANFISPRRLRHHLLWTSCSCWRELSTFDNRFHWLIQIRFQFDFFNLFNQCIFFLFTFVLLQGFVHKLPISFYRGSLIRVYFLKSCEVLAWFKQNLLQFLELLDCNTFHFLRLWEEVVLMVALLNLSDFECGLVVVNYLTQILVRGAQIGEVQKILVGDRFLLWLHRLAILILDLLILLVCQRDMVIWNASLCHLLRCIIWQFRRHFIFVAFIMKSHVLVQVHFILYLSMTVITQVKFLFVLFYLQISFVPLHIFFQAFNSWFQWLNLIFLLVDNLCHFLILVEQHGIVLALHSTWCLCRKSSFGTQLVVQLFMHVFDGGRFIRGLCPLLTWQILGISLFLRLECVLSWIEIISAVRKQIWLHLLYQLVLRQLNLWCTLQLVLHSGIIIHFLWLIKPFLKGAFSTSEYFLFDVNIQIKHIEFAPWFWVT